VLLAKTKSTRAYRGASSSFFEIVQRAGHAEVQSQPELAIGAHKQMFAITPTDSKRRPFNAARKLSR